MLVCNGVVKAILNNNVVNNSLIIVTDNNECYLLFNVPYDVIIDLYRKRIKLQIEHSRLIVTIAEYIGTAIRKIQYTTMDFSNCKSITEAFKLWHKGMK